MKWQPKSLPEVISPDENDQNAIVLDSSGKNNEGKISSKVLTMETVGYQINVIPQC